MAKAGVIRKFRADEWPAYRDLRLRALIDSPDAFARTYEEEKDRPDEEWASRLQGWITSPVSLCSLALMGNEPVGILFARVEGSENGAVRLYSMWVAPSARRHGMGGLLVANALSWSRSQAAKQVVLQVTEVNTAAIALYERFGFRATSIRAPLRAGSGLFGIGMELNL